MAHLPKARIVQPEWAGMKQKRRGAWVFATFPQARTMASISIAVRRAGSIPIVLERLSSYIDGFDEPGQEEGHLIRVSLPGDGVAQCLPFLFVNAHALVKAPPMPFPSVFLPQRGNCKPFIKRKLHPTLRKHRSRLYENIAESWSNGWQNGWISHLFRSLRSRVR